MQRGVHAVNVLAMKVLTVYAHPDPKSFGHAVLEQFTAGLQEAGHGVQVVDLYAIKFDPVFRTRDMASYLHEDMPPDILEAMNLKQRVLDNVPGGPVGQRVASRWLRDKSTQEVARFIRQHAALRRDRHAFADSLAPLNDVEFDRGGMDFK